MHVSQLKYNLVFSIFKYCCLQAVHLCHQEEKNVSYILDLPEDFSELTEKLKVYFYTWLEDMTQKHYEELFNIYNELKTGNRYINRNNEKFRIIYIISDKIIELFKNKDDESDLNIINANEEKVILNNASGLTEKDLYGIMEATNKNESKEYKLMSDVQDLKSDVSQILEMAERVDIYEYPQIEIKKEDCETQIEIKDQDDSQRENAQYQEFSKITEQTCEIQNVVSVPEEDNQITKQNDLQVNTQRENVQDEERSKITEQTTDVQNAIRMPEENEITELGDNTNIIYVDDMTQTEIEERISNKKRKQSDNDVQRNKIQRVYLPFGYLAVYYRHSLQKGAVSFSLASLSYIILNEPCDENWIQKLIFYVKEMNLSEIYVQDRNLLKYVQVYLPNIEILWLSTKSICINCKKCSCTSGKIQQYFKKYHNVNFNSECV